MSVNKILVNNLDSNYTHSIFDISEYTGNSYNTLSDALDDVPIQKRKGGMTIRYVLTNDNKYVHFTYLPDDADTVVTFTNPDNWEGITDYFKRTIIHGTTSDEIIEIKSDDDTETIVEISKNGVNAKNLKSNNVDVLEELNSKQPLTPQVSQTEGDIDIPDCIQIKDDEDNIVVEITNEYCDFTNLKSNGQDVLTNKDIKSPEICNNASVPIVVFNYDDCDSGKDEQLVALFDERNIKGTFSPVGSTNLSDGSTWDLLGKKMQEWVKNGHGTVSHGVPYGITCHPVDGGIAGIKNICDSEFEAVTKANLDFLNKYKLQHNGIVYYNVWENNPHTISLVEKHFKYGIIIGDGFNTPSTNLWKLKRKNTDYDGYLSSWKSLVDRAIGKNCIIAFGGHASRTGQYASDADHSSYSKMADFVELLDYIKEKIDAGQMISLNWDDALSLLYSRCIANGSIKDEPLYNPVQGNIYYDSNGTIKYCVNDGVCGKYEISFSGTPSSGEIVLSNIHVLGSDGQEKSNVTIQTSSGTISDVIEEFLGQVYKNYTVTKKDNSAIVLQSNASIVTEVPAVVTNTSGLTINITTINQGTEASWV